MLAIFLPNYLYMIMSLTMFKHAGRMDGLGTWGGSYPGYRDGDDLWTQDVCRAGHCRQITSQAKIGLKQASFAPVGPRIEHAFYAHYSGCAMSAGYADFPGSWTLR